MVYLYSAAEIVWGVAHNGDLFYRAGISQVKLIYFLQWGVDCCNVVFEAKVL